MFKKNMSGAVLGVGVDIVAVDRFSSWVGSAQRLSKIFTQQEIVTYLHEFGLTQNSVTPKDHDAKCAYWAARFAAKEAFYKAFSNVLVHFQLTQKTFSLTFACQQVEVVKGTWDIPSLLVHWYAFEKKIGEKLPSLQTQFSFAHEKNYATATVIITH